MAKYSVVKFFGHFRQDWEVYANSEDEAMNTAESSGILRYQTMYLNPFTNQSNYAINQDEKDKNNPPITADMEIEWLREAAEMGMVITPQEYERIYGLPVSTIY